MERRTPPHTEEGWYALHDFRTIDWDAYADAPDGVRERAIEEGVAYLEDHVAVEDASEGATAVYAMLGHEADLLVLHLRPSTGHLDAAQRRLERSALGRFTDRAHSYVSVTEASGYTEKSREYFEGDGDADSGIGRYIEARLHPTIPDAEHVCFYPMDKRRDPEQNWYDLPFDERAEHMEAHGDVGRDYAGKVVQMITGSIGFDDWEWGVTLWGDDATDIKDLLYEMRFDPSTSQYAEFGPFYLGRRMAPSDLEAYLAGDPVGVAGEEGTDAPVHPADAEGHPGDAEGHPADAGGHPGGDESGHPHAEGGPSDDDGGHPQADEEESADSGGRPGGDGDVQEVDDVEQHLVKLGLDEGEEYNAGDFALVLYADVEARDLAEAVDDLRGDFEHYDSHVSTSVRAGGGRAAVVSVWEGERAATTAAGFLRDIEGISDVIGGHVDGGSTPERATSDADLRGELADLDVYAGSPHGEDVHAMVVYSEADPSVLADEVGGLREDVADAAGHVKTAVYSARDRDRAAVVSLWETREGADAVGERLGDLPGVVARAGETSGFGTMGMFYTVKSDRRGDFLEAFEGVLDLLGDMAGHRETDLLVNLEDEDDMFIASQWRAREDAMEFFRSDAFAETVQFGRDVLADRPRHVFLA